MSVLAIKKYPDPILKKKTERVSEITNETKKLIQDMKETMEKNQGVGLAANQVGIDERIIVVKTGTKPGDFLALVNPRILEKSRKIEMGEEGCLSIPGLFLNIKRAKKIEIEGIKEDGEKIKIEAEGLLARIFQHEIDHIEGILIIDRLPFFQRLKIKKKLK